MDDQKDNSTNGTDTEFKTPDEQAKKVLGVNEDGQESNLAAKETSNKVDAPQHSNSTHQDKPKTMMLVLVILILAVAGGAAAWLLGKDSDKPKTAKVAEVVKKEIPILKIVNIDGDFTATLYPPTLPNSNPIILVRSQIFNTLVAFADQKDIVPQLSTSWTNPDTSTWVFKLRSGVKFHNGNAFTAKAAKESIEAEMAISDYEPFTSTIKSVEATDDLLTSIRETFPFNPAKRNESTEKNCLDCNWFPVCTSGCPVNNERVTGEAFTISPLHDFYAFVIPRYINFYGVKLLQKAKKLSVQNDMIIS